MDIKTLEKELTKSTVEEPTQEELAKAQKDIEALLDGMKFNLQAAQIIADKYGLMFSTELLLPPGNKGTGHPGYRDYHPATFKGTYHGANSITDEIALESLTQEEFEALKGAKDYPKNKEGYWYWHNSSLNC